MSLPFFSPPSSFYFLTASSLLSLISSLGVSLPLFLPSSSAKVEAHNLVRHYYTGETSLACARTHTHICVWKNSTNLRLTLSPSAVRIIFGACVGEKWELRRARQKSRAKGAFACQWELIHLEKSGLKSPWEVKESQKSLSHSHSRLFLMFPLQFFIISPLFFNNPSVLTMSRAIGPVIAWKEHNSKVKLVRNGKKKQKKHSPAQPGTF